MTPSLTWATTWMADANELVAPRLGLPELPVVDFPDDEEPPRGQHRKKRLLTRWAAGRPFGILYGVVLYDQIAHHVVMITATWIALIATAWTVGRTGLSLAAAAALAAVAAGLFLWGRRGRFIIKTDQT